MAVSPTADELGPYWTGDAPKRPVLVEFVDDYDELTDPPAEVITAELRNPQRVVVAEPNIERRADTPGGVAEVRVIMAGLPAFVKPGVWSILLRAGGDRLRPLRFVVEQDDGWVSIEQAREDWADAPSSDAQLYVILESAKLSIVPYAPALPANADVPANYVQAQLMQARNIWNSTKSDPGDQVGAEGFAIRVYELDRPVKGLLRPKQGRPIIR
jgi:hypothetical protein